MENILPDFATSPTSKSSSQAADSEHPADFRHGHKRQKLTSSSSRGVANLTPEQLAKKRANDREAQRAIRERTKTQIETLEQKIKELTSQQPYQDLQGLIRQKDILQSENEEIRRQLASVIQTLQACIGNTGKAHRFSQDPAVDAQVPRATIHAKSNDPNYPSMTPLRTRGLSNTTSPNSPYASSSHAPGLSTPSQLPPTYSTPTSAHVSRHDNQLSGGHTAGEKLDLGFVLDPNTQQQDMHAEKHHPRAQGHPHPPQSYHQTSSPHPNSSLHNQSPYPINFPSPEFYNSGLSAHNAPLRNCDPTCPLDTLLLDFQRDQRQRLIEGARIPEIIGPPYPSFSSLLDHERSKFAHPLSQVHTTLLGNFPHICDLPEQVAVCYIMFTTMRWTISRIPETYDNMPHWISPRPSQLLTPHPAWMDNLPWPKMRDKMVQIFPDIHFDDFFIPYTISLSVNWPGHPSDVLLKPDGSKIDVAKGMTSMVALAQQGEMKINPEFERHLRRLENWSLGPEFTKAFPQLDGFCPIREKYVYRP